MKIFAGVADGSVVIFKRNQGEKERKDFYLNNLND